MKINKKLCEKDGTIRWYLVTKRGSLLHREDGPAVEYLDGTKEWWYKNTKLDCSSDKEFAQYLKMKAFW